MKVYSKLLDRLWPERLRRKQELTNEERAVLFANVRDEDPCLKAVLDVLQTSMETMFYVAINPALSDADRLRALGELRACYYVLAQIEAERKAARRNKTVD